MKRFFLTFLLMMTAAVCAAEMNYDLPSTHLTYTQLEADAVPMLIDEPSPQAILGGADGETEIVIAQTQELSWPQTFTITVAGDTTLGSTDDLRKRDDCFENVAAEKGYAWFLSGLTELFGADDLTLVNFEGTLTEETQKKEKLYNFKGPAEYTDILTLGSVEAVNIANNHTLDYGEQGRADTIQNLEAAGLTVSGNGQLGICE